jgi:hypothetical protein
MIGYRMQLGPILLATSNTPLEFQPAYKILPTIEPAIHAENQTVDSISPTSKIYPWIQLNRKSLPDIRTYN